MFLKKRMVNEECMQGYDPSENEFCNGGSSCATCGWNIHEHSRRVKCVRDSGLKRNAYGVFQLVVKHNSGEIPAYD